MKRKLQPREVELPTQQGAHLGQPQGLKAGKEQGIQAGCTWCGEARRPNLSGTQATSRPTGRGEGMGRVSQCPWNHAQGLALSPYSREP